MHSRYFWMGGEGGFALIFAMLLTGLAALLALQAVTRAQVDTRLSGQEVAAAEADLVARGLLDALLDDARAQLGRGRPLATGDDLCSAPGNVGSECRNDFPRVWALLQRLPEKLQVSLSVARAGDASATRLPETSVSALGRYAPQLFAFRVQVSGQASAAFAATGVAVQAGTAAPAIQP